MIYWLKIANFWYLTSIWCRVGVTPSEFHSRVSCRWTTMMRLPGDEKSLIESLAVSIQYTNVTDGRWDGGRTDGHRTTAKTALCIASRDNKIILCYYYDIIMIILWLWNVAKLLFRCSAFIAILRNKITFRLRTAEKHSGGDTTGTKCYAIENFWLVWTVCQVAIW